MNCDWRQRKGTVSQLEAEVYCYEGDVFGEPKPKEVPFVGHSQGNDGPGTAYAREIDST